MTISHAVDTLLRSMTLEEKVGQVFVFTWKSLAQAENDLRFHPGGYIRIYSDVITVARQSHYIQSLSRIPLIIAADLERGIGGTIGGALETVTCMALGASGKEQNAYDAANMIGLEAAAMGINTNYAPVLDVNSNPANPVINTRSFGGSPGLVARMGVAFAKGLQDAGVSACGKHFPGHGDSGFDSHSSLGSVSESLERLKSVELVPFKAAIEADVDAIMSAHLLLPAIESEQIPATLSRKVMTDLLRNELGFKGVAVTDAMDMGAVAKHFAPEVAIPMAVNAGCDQLIMPLDTEAAVHILLQAVQSGMVSEERLDEAVGRILTLKEKRGILSAEPIDLGNVINKVSTPAHLERAAEIAADSITLVKGADLLPLQKEQRIFCLQFSNGGDSRDAFLEPRSFGACLATDGWHVTTADPGIDIFQQEAVSDREIIAAKAADVIVLAAYVSVRLHSGTISLPDTAMANIAPLLQLKKPVLLVSFGSPYIIKQFQNVTSYVCAFSATQPSQKAMADAIKGIANFRGTMPADIE